MIKEIEKKLSEVLVVDNHDDEEADRLLAKLEKVDPFNDAFHLACLHWPNCETEGCVDV